MRAAVASERCVLKAAGLLVVLLLSATAPSQNSTSAKHESPPLRGGQLRIPARASAPLFKGKQGKQKTEIHFDPVTRMVTLKLLVQDHNWYFIPNLRRDNFVVYEKGVRQQNATVEIEHAPVSLGLLMEFGGRAQALNRLLGLEITRAAHQALDALGKEDKIAVWKYSDKVEKLTDFSQDHEALDELFYKIGTPEFSETNLYDALIFTVDQMRSVTGRKAIVLISSGIDTFSKASYQDALKASQNSDCPIYVISLAPILRDIVAIHGSAGPLARVDWQKTERDLQEIARVSGGRAYSPENTLDLSSTYDDIMENLKVRYVITYRSSNESDLSSPRMVRVELVDSRTGGPLKIVDSNGRTIRANVIVQDSYVPGTASSGEE